MIETNCYQFIAKIITNSIEFVELIFFFTGPSVPSIPGLLSRFVIVVPFFSIQFFFFFLVPSPRLNEDSR